MDYSKQLVLMLGGREALRPVIARFYDKMAAHAQLGQFFRDVDLQAQVRKLEDFLCIGMPGEPPFTGNYPRLAHSHKYITDELLDARLTMLEAAIRECGHGDDVVALWLRTDQLWHGAVRKRRVEDCTSSMTGKPLIIPD